MEKENNKTTINFIKKTNIYKPVLLKSIKNNIKKIISIINQEDAVESSCISNFFLQFACFRKFCNFIFSWFWKKNYHLTSIDTIKSILYEYAEYEEITNTEIEECRERKNEIKGGFFKKIFIELFFFPQTATEEMLYYRENQSRYPELSINTDGFISKNYTIFSCHKLVRDNQILILEKENCIAVYKVLSDREYQQALVKKLSEEYSELELATTREQITEEIADLLDILAAFEKTVS